MCLSQIGWTSPCTTSSNICRLSFPQSSDIATCLHLNTHPPSSLSALLIQWKSHDLPILQYNFELWYILFLRVTILLLPAFTLKIFFHTRLNSPVKSQFRYCLTYQHIIFYTKLLSIIQGWTILIIITYYTDGIHEVIKSLCLNLDQAQKSNLPDLKKKK